MEKILVAYDGGEPARRALDTAAEMAKRFGATVSVVSVVPTGPSHVVADPWDTDAHARELLEARRILREDGIEADLLEPLGEPAPTIERIAEEGGFDVVVVGTRDLGAIARTFQGSVSQHVARHARSTVVVAR